MIDSPTHKHRNIHVMQHEQTLSKTTDVKKKKKNTNKSKNMLVSIIDSIFNKAEGK